MCAKRLFGELETTILHLFSKSDKGLTVSDVMKRLGGRNAYTTIMTVMTRLFEKGVLKRTKQGRSYLYSKKKSPLLKRLKSRFLGASPSEVFSTFLEEEVEPQEIAKIEKMIREHKKKWNT
ncbi:MAG: BlaI/MecI/CopY family transcriptional regulator [Simkaniaceae bacterium]|nr:MAG: BlaI/MecI/CopY family transcriptional regulator [Simkaniaceae bacterium]